MFVVHDEFVDYDRFRALLCSTTFLSVIFGSCFACNNANAKKIVIDCLEIVVS